MRMQAVALWHLMARGTRCPDAFVPLLPRRLAPVGERGRLALVWRERPGGRRRLRRGRRAHAQKEKRESERAAAAHASRFPPVEAIRASLRSKGRSQERGLRWPWDPPWPGGRPCLCMRACVYHAGMHDFSTLVYLDTPVASVASPNVDANYGHWILEAPTRRVRRGASCVVVGLSGHHTVL